MADACRSWWRNCAQEADAEILDIDRIEDQIAPLSPDVSKIRELITSLELCHHKADRWVSNLIEAIGAEQTSKGLGTRPPGQDHPVERVWRDACAALSAWCAGCPAASLEGSIGAVAASDLVARVGERSALKEWQVQRVIGRIRSCLRWAQTGDYQSARYVAMLEGGSEYESALRTECPPAYREHEELWLATVETLVHDTDDDEEAQISLALVIDLLMPCHWQFQENLVIALAAIGGHLHPDTPFAACARNLARSPVRDRMQVIAHSLRVFCGRSPSAADTDEHVLALLGEPTTTKQWLAASLDKTIRLQLKL